MYFLNAIVLAAFWLLGFLTSFTMGGFILSAIMLVLARVISGRNHVRIGQGN